MKNSHGSIVGKKVLTVFGVIGLLLCANVAFAEYQLLPMEMPPKSIPINGDDVVNDPEGVAVKYGFSTETANSIVDLGDSALMLDRLDWFATPHLDWVKNYARGPVRVLYLTSHRASRNAIELMQRSDFEFTLLQIPTVLAGAMKDGPAYFKERILKQLDGEYDVIVLPDILLGQDFVQNRPDYLADKIMEKVKGGCGLIILMNQDRWYRLNKSDLEKLDTLSPIRRAAGESVTGVPQRSDTFSPLTEAQSFAFWPPVTAGKNAQAAKEAAVVARVEETPFAATGAYGKGRVVGLCLGGGYESGLMPYPDPERCYRFGDWYETVYAFYLKAIVWAAGKEPRVSVAAPELVQCKTGDKPKVVLSIKDLTGKAQSLKLDWRLTDEWGVKIDGGTQETKAGSEATALELALPALAANGLYCIDFWLRDGEKIENWGCSTIQAAGGVGLKVDVLEKSSAVGGMARYKITTGGVAGRLSVRGVDDMNRVFFSKTIDVKDGDSVEIDTRRSCLPRNRVEFTLSDGKQATARHFVQLYIPRIGLDSLDDDFLIASYGDTPTEDYLKPYMGMLYREAGFNTYYGNWHNRSYIRDRAANLGLYSITGPGPAWVYVKQVNLEKILKCCPNNPEVRETWRKNIEISVGDQQFYGGIGRVLDDESFMAFTSYKDGEMRGAQACQCEYCLKCFRERMREKYADIAKLNNAWGTACKSFDELRVIEEGELKDNPSGWLEFRQFMNWTYANNYYGWVQEQHKPLGTDYGSGPGAPGYHSREGGPTYRGGDYSFLKNTLHFMMAYGGSEPLLYTDAYIGQPGAQKYDPPTEWKQRGGWYRLLNGADALWYYYGSSMIGNELAWRKQGEWALQGVKDIRDGAGTLVSGAKLLNRQVRVFYSSENMAMGWLFGKRKDDWSAFRLMDGLPLSQATFETLFDQFLFIRPGYVTAEEIQKGDLADCKLLFLPQAFNMDDATADAVKRYVKEGGKVLADVLPATRERYGKLRAVSPLEELFGVDASEAKLHKESEVWYSIGVGFKSGGGALDDASYELGRERIWLPGQTSFLDVKPTTAKIQGVALSKVGKEANACFINSYGDGKALLLNFQYCNFDADTSGWHAMFGKTLMGWAGVKAQARIVSPVTGAPLAYRPLREFQRGKATLLGAIRGNSVWMGGKPVLTDPGRAMDVSDAVGDKAKFTWDVPAYAYNVRTRQFLGHGTEAMVDLPSYEGRLIALLPYKVEKVELKIPSKVKAGELVTVKAKVVAANAMPDEHVLRLEVTSPTGYMNLIYCKTRTAKHGETEFQIPFADNDRIGDWKVVVRDVMTGVEGTVVVALK